MDADVPAVLAEVHAHGPGKDPRPGAPPPRPSPRRAGGAALDTLARSGPFGRAVSRTLQLALGPRRWEPWNAYNDHRAYPSPRAAYLVDVALRGGAGRWPVDPVRGRLVGATDGAARAALSGTGPVHLELSVHPGRMPAGYGPLATALGWLEAGHAAAAVVEVATALGLRPECTAAAAPGAGWPAWSAVEIALTPGGDGGWPWERVVAARSSGLGPRGVTPDPRPLPEADLRALVRSAAETPAGSPARWPGLRHALAVRGVTGLADGWYSVTDGAPVRRGSGPALDEVQAAFSYPRTSIDVAGANVGWVMTAGTDAAVRAGGRPAYHRLLLAAGAVAQHVGTAAAAASLFCRPARSVHEALLEAAADVPADHDLVYLLLIGRSRVRDHAYDLTNPELLS